MSVQPADIVHYSSGLMKHAQCWFDEPLRIEDRQKYEREFEQQFPGYSDMLIRKTLTQTAVDELNEWGFTFAHHGKILGYKKSRDFITIAKGIEGYQGNPYKGFDEDLELITTHRKNIESLVAYYFKMLA